MTHFESVDDLLTRITDEATSHFVSDADDRAALAARYGELVAESAGIRTYVRFAADGSVEHSTILTPGTNGHEAVAYQVQGVDARDLA